jgi:hypothetical protein
MERILSNWKSTLLLLRMQNSKTTLERSLKVIYNLNMHMSHSQDILLIGV